MTEIEPGTKLSSTKLDIAHIQYPALGFDRFGRFGLTPYGLSARRVATFHEYSIFQRLRKASVLPFAFVNARIFSSEVERDIYAAEVRWRRGSDHVIPIGSNVPAAPRVIRHPRSVCTFGLIMPNKGLEQFLELAEILQARGGYHVSMIGTAPKAAEAYSASIMERARKLGVHLLLDLDATGVSHALARHQIAYLRYPDGASVKRGSMIAALVNGCVVLTTFGSNTPDWLREIAVEATSPQIAGDIVAKLTDDPASCAALSDASTSAASVFNWDDIANKHLQLYSSLLA